jgi:hypothetical protein
VLLDDVQQHLLFLAAAHGVDHLRNALRKISSCQLYCGIFL